MGRKVDKTSVCELGYTLYPFDYPLCKPESVKIDYGTRYAIVISRSEKTDKNYLNIELQGKNKKGWRTTPSGPFFAVDYDEINPFVSVLKKVVKDERTRKILLYGKLEATVRVSKKKLEDVFYPATRVSKKKWLDIRYPFSERVCIEWLPKEKANEFIKCIEKVAKKKLAKSTIWRNKAEALYTLERFDEAIEPYRKYLKKFPDDALVLSHIGFSYMTAKDQDLDKAESCIRKSIELTQDDGTEKNNDLLASSWSALGEIYRQKGNKKESGRYFEISKRYREALYGKKKTVKKTKGKRRR